MCVCVSFQYIEDDWTVDIGLDITNKYYELTTHIVVYLLNWEVSVVKRITQNFETRWKILMKK